MNKEQLNSVLEKHKKWLDGEDGGERADLRDADLRGANLRGANLCGADLRYANLRDANLRDANLRDVDLRYANLRGTDMCGADLRDANLRYVDLRYANLRGTDMRDADLRGTNLRGTDMRDVDLRGADLDYSCWPLWCGSLGAIIDDRIARQLLYHVLSVIGCSPVSQDIKDAALTPELIEVANAFHRVQDHGCKKIGGNKDD